MGVGWGTEEGQAEAESTECKAFQKPDSPNWRNRIVGHWIGFFAWPWRAQSELRMKQDTCWSPQTGVPFPAPTQLPYGHQAAVVSKHTPGSTAYPDSGKWKVRNLSGLLFLLNWSDQWRENEGVYFVSHSSLVVKQFNRKQTPQTHKYPKHKGDQSSSQFCRSWYRKQYQRALISKHRIKELVGMVRGNVDRIAFLNTGNMIKLQSVSLTFKASEHWKF